MSVQIYNTLGYVKCDFCDNPLTLSFKTHYQKCESCGWPVDIKHKPKEPFMKRYHQLITNPYLNSPCALAVIIWVLGLLNGMMITYLIIR